MKRREDNDGNALFLILIAVALFAALSYAVTSSGRGSGTVNKESMLLAASQVLQQAGMVQQAITKMKLINGCSDATINFYGGNTNWISNPASPSDKSCNVFDPNGGGLTVVKPPSGVQTVPQGYLFNSGLGFVDVLGIENCKDMAFALTNVTKEFCDAINKVIGNDDFNPIPGYVGNGQFNPTVYPWEGCDPIGVYGWTFSNQSSAFTGKTAFCGTGSSGAYIFSYALILK